MLADSISAATQPTTGSQPIPWYANPQEFLIPLIAVVIVVMMLSTSRNKKTEQKQRDDMLKNMKRGDRVMTAGGIFGTVVDVRDTEVVLKVDEGTNTKIKFSRDAIKRVLVDEEPSAK